MDDSSTIEKSKHNAFYEQKYLEDFKVYVRSLNVSKISEVDPRVFRKLVTIFRVYYRCSYLKLLG